MSTQEDINIYRTFVNKQIGISISFPEAGELPETANCDLILAKKREIVRYLQYAGITIGFGGDFRSQESGGITLTMMSQLSADNSLQKFYQRNLMVNYVVWPISVLVASHDYQEFQGKLHIRPVKMPSELIEDADPTEFISPDNINNRYCWARSLTSMRQQMARHMDSRIAMYGKTSNYKGFHPGVVEEIYWTMRYRKPVYLLGSFGGVTSHIIEALQGGSPEVLTEEYQRKDVNRANLIDYTRQKMGDDFVGPNDIISFFNEKGLERLNNGLSVEENEHLMHTNHVSEMITLIIKGLTYIYG
ncbi:hypothetical protein AB9P05_02805 [Roseivirga sp. BDSF3-8]|uniref:hypothetical protein n=1 Tax=Roseivirga sp. BDSF3-8 TaxID=3241598 RepID=UPI003531ACA7